MIQISEKQGRKTLELMNAELVVVSDEQKGTSQRTGREWKARFVNIKFSLGTNSNGYEDSMLVRARCLDSVCERIGMAPIGTKIHAHVRFDVDTRFKFPQLVCTLVDFTF